MWLSPGQWDVGRNTACNFFKVSFEGEGMPFSVYNSQKCVALLFKALLFWICSHPELILTSLTKLFFPENLTPVVLWLRWLRSEAGNMVLQVYLILDQFWGRSAPLKVISYIELHLGILTWAQTFAKAALHGGCKLKCRHQAENPRGRRGLALWVVGSAANWRCIPA